MLCILHQLNSDDRPENLLDSGLPEKRTRKVKQCIFCAALGNRAVARHSKQTVFNDSKCKVTTFTATLSGKYQNISPEAIRQYYKECATEVIRNGQSHAYLYMCFEWTKDSVLHAHGYVCTSSPSLYARIMIRYRRLGYVLSRACTNFEGWEEYLAKSQDDKDIPQSFSVVS